MKAVCMPRKILSPVIILVLISQEVRVSRVCLASVLIRLTKVTTPRILVFLRKSAL